MDSSPQTLVAPRPRPALAARVVALALVALGLGVAFLAAAPAPAQAARGLEIGIQDDSVFRHRNYYDIGLAYRQARALEASTLRVMVGWAPALGRQAAKRRRPRKLRYDWSKWDAVVADATANGMKVQFVLTGEAPAFATANRRIGPIRPNARLFGQFVKAAATHFKGRVTRYSIWNEPNWSGWLNGDYNRGAGKTYRRLYKAGYRQIKRADRSAQVLFGETAPYYQRRRALAPLRFMRDALCLNSRWRRKRGCGGLRADGFAHHPYEFAHGPRYRMPGADNVTMGTLYRLRRALHRARRARALRRPTGGTVPIFLTEWGYQAAGRRGISDRRRAVYTRQAFDIARRTPGVRQLLQYILVQPPAHIPGSAFNTGIVELWGRTTKPYRALRGWAKKNRSRIKRHPHNVKRRPPKKSGPEPG